jgi:hypothetical protein
MKRFAIALLMTAAILAPVPSDAQQAPSADRSSVSATSRPSASDSQSNGNRRRRNRRNTSDNVDLPAASSTTPNPIPLAADFDLLTQRSIFVKSRGNRGSGGGGGGFDTPRPEDSYVFNGVTESEHKTVAFIEDTSTQKVQIAQVGDSIAQGKITRIVLDGLDYKNSQGATVHVLVGQNLRGRDAWNQTYGIATESTESTSSTETPSDPATAALIARMKQKRMQELNGGVAPTPTTAPSSER